jgi:hypothetical protein
MMAREDVRTRYAELRAISNKHHNAALQFVSRQSINRNARSLGMMVDGSIAAESDEEMALLFDLCVYHAERGRSRALDRYTQAARAADGSSDACMLKAMANARFSLWQVVRPHEVAGTVVFDMLREREAWLIDNGLEASGPEGMVFAARLTEPEEFALTCGVIAPIDELTLLDVAGVEIHRRSTGTPEDMADDPRFAVAVYRAVLENGMMDIVRFK